ncbi:MAG: hypothetical protein ACP5JP_10575 [bacterium]
MKRNKHLMSVTFIILLFASCAVQNNSISNESSLKERYANIKQEERIFTVNIIPPDGGRSLFEGRQLEAPYSVRVAPGNTYQIEMYTKDGTGYRGTIQVLGEGGAVGRYSGYDIRLYDYVIDMLKHDMQVSFYINSPDGRQVLLVTFYAP